MAWRKPSAFQLFPSHIVETIVGYVCCSSYPGCFESCEHTNNSGELLKPLLWVCYNFRAFIYARFCKRYQLQLCANVNWGIDTRHSWPPSLRWLTLPTRYLARELIIEFVAESVYDGMVFRQLSNRLYAGCSFPQVRKLLLRIHFHHAPDKRYNLTKVDNAFGLDCNDDLLSSSDEDSSLDHGNSHQSESDDDFLAESNGDFLADSDLRSVVVDNSQTKGFRRKVVANINAFVGRIKQMAPMVNEVWFLDAVYDEEGFVGMTFKNRNVFFSDLERKLVNIAGNPTLYHPR